MATEVALLNPIRAYLDVRRGLLSNRDLIGLAQGRLADHDVPLWIEQLAYLHPHDVLDAHHVLESYLMQSGVLPDSRQLREQIQCAVVEWADRTATTGIVDTVSFVPSVVRLLRLCPGYELSSASVPVEEFPYPLSRVQTASELASYIKEHIDELVPMALRPA